MYDYVDRSVERLGNGSRFVLWAMRAWVNAAKAGRCPRVAIGGGFVNMGAAAAVADFATTMTRLRDAPGEPLRFANMACRRIAEGEAILLAMWADLAAGDYDNALAVLRLMVPAGSAALIGEAMAGACDHLRHAGLAPLGLAGPGTVASSGSGGDER